MLMDADTSGLLAKLLKRRSIPFGFSIEADTHLPQVYAVYWYYATQAGCRVGFQEVEGMNHLVLVAEDKSTFVAEVVSVRAAIAGTVVFALGRKMYGGNRQRSGNSAGLAGHYISHHR